MVSQSVTEREAGTITETGEQAKVASSEEVKIPVSGRVSSETPKTYTEKELKDAVKAAEGRASKYDELKQQADTFKTQAEQATTSLEETKVKITDLEADLEQAIGEDADLIDIKKIKTDLRAERDKARQEVKAEREAVAELKRTTEAERLEWAETVAEAQTFKFDGELARVVDEYDGDVTANFNKLKTACERAGIKTKEGAEAIAELSFVKKAEEPDLVYDSGVTNGGGSASFERIRDDMIKNPSNDAKMQRYMDAKKAQGG